MMDYRKYRRQYYLPPEDCRAWTGKDCIDTAPLWCSVDLRDGNQALVVPMSLEEKLKFFRLLVDIGFKEIEVGFPAASDTEYRFIRTLIEKDMIPEDVTIQVLTQAREHIIRKTFDAVRGARKAIVHLYNSTSPMQRDYVFGKSKEEILQIAVSGAELFGRFCFKLLYQPPLFRLYGGGCGRPADHRCGADSQDLCHGYLFPRDDHHRPAADPLVPALRRTGLLSALPPEQAGIKGALCE